MHRTVAACAPAGTLLQIWCVVFDPDENLTRRPMLGLRMAFETKIWIAFDQQLAVYRTVWVVTHGATFAQGLMLEHKRPRLLAMTFGAVLIKSSHRQAARGLKDIGAMGIMALHAIHPAFEDRMMLGKVEFGMGLEVAPEAGGRILPGIDDELSAPAARFEVLAAGSVA